MSGRGIGMEPIPVVRRMIPWVKVRALTGWYAVAVGDTLLSAAGRRVATTTRPATAAAALAFAFPGLYPKPLDTCTLGKGLVFLTPGGEEGAKGRRSEAGGQRATGADTRSIYIFDPNEAISF